MTRYFFHVHNGVGFVPDEEGQELRDLDAASAHATRGIRSILSEEVQNGRLDLRGRIEIADADGTLLLVMPYGEAVSVQLADTRSNGASPEELPG